MSDIAGERGTAASLYWRWNGPLALLIPSTTPGTYRTGGGVLDGAPSIPANQLLEGFRLYISDGGSGGTLTFEGWYKTPAGVWTLIAFAGALTLAGGVNDAETVFPVGACIGVGLTLPKGTRLSAQCIVNTCDGTDCLVEAIWK